MVGTVNPTVVGKKAGFPPVFVCLVVENKLAIFYFVGNIIGTCSRWKQKQESNAFVVCAVGTPHNLLESNLDRLFVVGSKLLQGIHFGVRRWSCLSWSSHWWGHLLVTFFLVNVFASGRFSFWWNCYFELWKGNIRCNSHVQIT